MLMKLPTDLADYTDERRFLFISKKTKKIKTNLPKSEESA